MARHKNANWLLNEPAKTWDECQLAVLMDLRDELRDMNHKLSVLQCTNFIRIPRMLDAIRLQTRKRKYVKRKKGRA